MNCNELFFSNDDTEETLHQRTKLSSVILDKGVAKKNELIEFMRGELSESFGCQVFFWLQGSYKSHTLIKPVDMISSYDIDVGIYLFFDAEAEGIESKDVKSALKDALTSYCQINNEAELQKSKNACEGLVYSAFLTIDMPIYYKTDESIKLATDSGWVDSDPKAIQEWLTNYYEDASDRALMKRLIRYLKAWINVKWQGTDFKKIPSLAVNVLVAQNLSKCVRDDDAFIVTALNICEYLETTLIVRNPLNGDNLLSMPQDSEVFAYKKLDELKAVCLRCKEASEFERGILFSNLFQHYFPQIVFGDTPDGSVGLPSVTTVPIISICRYDKKGVHVETVVTNKSNSLTIRKGDSLTFTICNHADFNEYSDAHWTVRNVGNQANDANDIGHKVIGKTNQSHQRNGAYTGSHTMECLITHNGLITGFQSIYVKVIPVATLIRNRTFRGGRR